MVKDGRSTIAVPLKLVDLSKVEVGGIDSVAVKCIDIIKNSNCVGSPFRVPTITCWQLNAGVALVAGLNPTPHGTS